MNLAILSHYFQSVIPPRMVYQTRRMVFRIRNVFSKAIDSSSWVSRDTAYDAIRTLDEIKAYVGSPGRRLDPEFVEEIYKPYPDAPLDKFFPTWIQALGHSSRYMWIDKTTVLYNELETNAYYRVGEEILVVPPGIMHSPFVYLYAPLGLNYGGLGTLIAHEFMHAFDLNNIRGPFWTDEFRKKYTERALCLRRSHKSVLATNLQEILNDTVDSENLADFVGTRTAYDAFASLPEKYKSVKLADFNMTSEQLFFVSHCRKWCAQLSETTEPYAPFRSRCIVPLRNMPEFSRAFGCSAGTYMNPHQKCTFW
ncbi:hypothetical protein MTO96_034844 [Rhipicephalus appendiculatus]